MRNLPCARTHSHFLSASSMLLLAVIGCSSSKDAEGGSPQTQGGAPFTAPSCPAKTSILKVTGALGGMPVSVELTPAPGGFSQVSSGEFDVPTPVTINGMSLANPDDVAIHLEWKQTVEDDRATDASGTVKMPKGSARAGEQVCAGAGSQIYIASADNSFTFELKSLKVGTDCKEALAGSLQGCWNSNF